MVDAGGVDLAAALLVLFARTTRARLIATDLATLAYHRLMIGDRLIDNFSDTGHLFINSSGSILMFKAHLASQLFRAIFLLHLNVGNDADSFVLDLNQHLGEQLKRFPLVFLPLHTPLLFQTFGRNGLINKSVYYLSTEVGNGFADIIGIQQTVTLGVNHLALVVSHSLRLISVVCFDRFVTGYQKLNHYQESHYPEAVRRRVIS